MEPLRFAAVRYLNTAPLIHGLDTTSGVEVLLAAPSHIADLVASGQADLGLVSLIDALRSPVPLSLVPAGMIGCDGPTLTVRVFSADPFDRVATLHADTDSHTSVVLAQLLFKHRFGRTVTVVDFDAREQIALAGRTGTNAESPTDRPRTLLLIGDKVVTDAPSNELYPHQLDLGEAWKSWTGLPFVYAVWMCRSSEARTDRVRLAAALADRQLRHNLTRLPNVIADRAPAHRWPPALAARYLGELLRYRVGDRERDAAARFLAEAARAGLAPAGEVRWISPFESELSPFPHAEPTLAGVE